MTVNSPRPTIAPDRSSRAFHAASALRAVDMAATKAASGDIDVMSETACPHWFCDTRLFPRASQARVRPLRHRQRPVGHAISGPDRRDRLPGRALAARWKLSDVIVLGTGIVGV